MALDRITEFLPSFFFFTEFFRFEVVVVVGLGFGSGPSWNSIGWRWIGGVVGVGGVVVVGGGGQSTSRT